MEIEYNPNINPQTATTDELITELLILEDYTNSIEANHLYNQIQTELNKRETITADQERQAKFDAWFNEGKERNQNKPIRQQTTFSPYARPDRYTIDGKPF